MARLVEKYQCSLQTIRNDARLALQPGPHTFVPTSGVKLFVKNRDNEECQYCKSPNRLIFEHVIPQAKGGDGGEYNIVMACLSCNSLKKSNVWTPSNFEKLTYGNPEWGQRILQLSSRDCRVNPPEQQQFKPWSQKDNARSEGINRVGRPNVKEENRVLVRTFCMRRDQFAEFDRRRDGVPVGVYIARELGL